MVASRARRQTENQRQGGEAGAEWALPSDFRARDGRRIAGKAEGANRGGRWIFGSRRSRVARSRRQQADAQADTQA